MIKLPNSPHLISKNDCIIVGLSGGPDSVYLLHALAALRETHNLTLIAAHLNHETRKESDADEQFCRDLCAKLNVPFISKSLSQFSPTLAKKGSPEALWRVARRTFFASVAAEHGAEKIALGHHRDDQVETFFIRLIRGSSLAGLTCMKLQEGPYIRPLLSLSKADIVRALTAHSISYLQDSSNKSDAFLRNRIRNKAIPALAACDERFSQNVTATMARLADADAILQQCAQDYLTQTDDGTQLNLESFLQAPSALQHYVITAWLKSAQVAFTPSQGFFDEIIRFLAQPGTGQHALHQNWCVAKKKNMARITDA